MLFHLCIPSVLSYYDSLPFLYLPNNYYYSVESAAEFKSIVSLPRAQSKPILILVNKNDMISCANSKPSTFLTNDEVANAFDLSSLTNPTYIGSCSAALNPGPIMPQSRLAELQSHVKWVVDSVKKSYAQLEEKLKKDKEEFAKEREEALAKRRRSTETQ